MPQLKLKKTVSANYPLILGGILIAIFAVLVIFRLHFYTIFNLNYLVIHTILEGFSIFVALGIFVVTWFTFEQTNDNQELFLGVSFLLIAIIDFCHTISFQGMPFFNEAHYDESTKFWVLGRFTEAAVFILMPHIYKIGKYILLLGVMLLSGTIFVIINYYYYLLPVLLIKDVGLTPLKIGLEYFIIGLLIWAAYIYWQKYKYSMNKSYLGINMGLIFAIFSELCFTIYFNSYDTLKKIGTPWG